MLDEAIIALFWKRDERAIRETDQKYGRYLTKIAYNVLADLEDSKESVNDTYLHAWNSMPPQKPNMLSTYLAKITRRVSIDIFRKRNRKKRQASQYIVSLAELADCVSEGNTTEDTVDAQLLGVAINEFLKTLSDDARNTFVGRYYFMDSIAEVAAYCGMSQAKVKSMLYRTCCALKTHLEMEGFDV